MFKEWGYFGTRVSTFDRDMTPKSFNFVDRDDYYKKASCNGNIPSIKTPTLFVMALDDPFISQDCIDYDVFKKNENVALATTEMGGHLGYHESVWSNELWVMRPCLKFFGAICKNG